MTLQQKAQQRNWAKKMIAGICIQTSALTENEKKLVQTIFNIKEMLIRDWNNETPKLGLKVTKKLNINHDRN